MTNRQAETIAQLRDLGYMFDSVRYGGNGCMVLRVYRKMRRGTVTLICAPNGRYRLPAHTVTSNTPQERVT